MIGGGLVALGGGVRGGRLQQSRCCWSARSTATGGSTRASRPRSTRPRRGTGSWWRRATTTRAAGRRSGPSQDPGQRRGLRRRAHRHSRPPPAGHEPLHGHRRRDEGRVARRAASSKGPELRGPTPPGATASSSAKANNVSVQNLTVCNFLSGAGEPRATRSGGTAATTSGKIGLHGLLGDIPDGHLHLLRGREHRRRLRDLLVELQRRAAGTSIYASNFNDSGVVRRGLPADMHNDHRPRLDGVQRPRATRGRTPAGRSWSRTPSSTTTRTASTPTPQISGDPPAPQTGRARTTASARSPTPTRAGSSSTTTSHDNNNSELAGGRLGGRRPGRAPG